MSSASVGATGRPCLKKARPPKRVNWRVKCGGTHSPHTWGAEEGRYQVPGSLRTLSRKTRRRRKRRKRKLTRKQSPGLNVPWCYVFLLFCVQDPHPEESSQEVYIMCPEGIATFTINLLSLEKHVSSSSVTGEKILSLLSHSRKER